MVDEAYPDRDCWIKEVHPKSINSIRKPMDHPENKIISHHLVKAKMTLMLKILSWGQKIQTPPTRLQINVKQLQTWVSYCIMNVEFI